MSQSGRELRMAIWDDLISPEDRKAYEKYRAITNIGFGKRHYCCGYDL